MAMDVASPRIPSRAWERTRMVLLNLLFACGVLLVGYLLYVTYEVKREETRMKEAEVERARVELARVVAYNEGLKDQVRFLQTREGVEKVAREKLGLIRPNETTYIVINAPAVQDPPSAPVPPETGEKKPSGVLDGVGRWVREVWNGGD